MARRGLYLKFGYYYATPPASLSSLILHGYAIDTKNRIMTSPRLGKTVISVMFSIEVAY